MTYIERMKEKAAEIRKQDVVRILAIESSCDETSVAVVENGRKVLSNIISSQIDIHKHFGGVVPEVASRNHILNIIPLVAIPSCLTWGMRGPSSSYGRIRNSIDA